jgi:DNA adenine methylase
VVDSVELNKNEGPKFLRWAGSKSKMLPKISYLIPRFNQYIEPFCGSCALFYSLHPKGAILGDTNSFLIRTIMAVRDKPEEVFEELEALTWSRTGFYAIRGHALAEPNDVRLAANFIYLNANCFNGIFRLNKIGRFNVPYGGDRAGKCPSLKKLLGSSKLLRGAKIVCSDFDSTVRNNLHPGDFVYLDPPFAVRSRRIFYQYRYDDFGTEDIDRLRGLMEWVDKKGGTFIVSYGESPEAETLRVGWKSTSVWRLGNIAGFRDNRRSAREIVITNITGLSA